MSTIIMSQCWPIEGMSPAQKAVLISLADQANDDGYCWPSVGTIASRTCLSERAVQGAIKWQEEGLTPSKKIREANSSYRKEMDVLETFVDELCNVGQGYQYRASEFYQDYIKWAQENRAYEMSHIEFGERMGKKFERARKSVGNVYLGVGKREIYPGLNKM